MPDQPADPRPLDPATEERVRRLLAEARHDEPMPADVVARLEGVLAELAEEPAAQGRVVELHRRRRRTTALLVAAAAVVVAGIGFQQLVRGGSEADLTSAGEERPVPANGLTDRAPAASPSGAEGFGTASDRDDRGGAAFDRLRKVRPQHFGTDVRQLQKAYDATVTSSNDSTVAGELSVEPGCRERSWGSGRLVAVSYDGSPGALVFRKPTGDTQVVDLFLCGYDDVVRTVTLPRP